MGKKITLQQIANELGTSKVTVSRALNNKEGISAELRAKILKRAEIYGYDVQTKNDVAINSLAFLIAKRFFVENDQFYHVIYMKLNNLCQSRGITLMAIVFSPEEEQSGVLTDSLSRRKFDGIFIAGDMDDVFLDGVAALGLPTIYIDFKKTDRAVMSVLADNYSLGYQVTDYLINKGHKKIGFVGDYKSNQNICDRYMGFRKALILAGLTHDLSYDFINNDYKTGLYTLNFHVPAPHNLPTAFICTCDMAAYYMYDKLKMMGIVIPDDISFISFDNTDICDNMEPPLTSVDISKEDFAALAFKQMIEQFVNPLCGARKLFVETKLIIRESVKNIN